LGAINVGWNRTTTLKQVLQALEEALGALPAVTYGPARSGDIRHSRANNQRLLASFKLPEPTR
jgi:UDP-glucose 4-epimerase